MNDDTPIVARVARMIVDWQEADGCNTNAIAMKVVGAVLEDVAADLSKAADENEKAPQMTTHNRAIAWALRGAALRYRAMAKEGT